MERGRYPEEALNFRMAVATRGMDHLRNRPTLEMNARIDDDLDFKKALYGGYVAAEPNGCEMVPANEQTFPVRSGDEVATMRILSGG